MKLRSLITLRVLCFLLILFPLATTGCNQYLFIQKSQTISFGQISSQTLGTAPLLLTATASLACRLVLLQILPRSAPFPVQRLTLFSWH